MNRYVSCFAGAPFHDFKKTSAEPIPSGEAVQIRFQLMPTAYTFAKVCSCRDAIKSVTPTKQSLLERCQED